MSKADLIHTIDDALVGQVTGLLFSTQVYRSIVQGADHTNPLNKNPEGTLAGLDRKVC